MIRRDGRAWPAACAPALALAVLLGACQKDTDPGPGGVTVGEARALDEAAEMLEKRPAPPQVDASGAVDSAADGAANAAPPAR
ncbi:hypothetical protein [Novosphingobium sp. Chol11]|uniref:hypothetical protein n=1 Tax=Novosphingobium sp. Chol11 TaxID=1385763 RepID=UPI0025CF2A23|nr:hypothetical protein [Novosphingobium sp. Chol11]